MTYFEPKDFLNIDNINEYVNQAYEKGRADAIDEFADKCIELQRALFVNPSVNELNQFKVWLCRIAEQLKEQNNDR